MQKMSFKVFLFLCLAPVAILLSEAKRFSHYGKASYEGHFCQNILKSSHLPRRK